jgi:hypothetical protein
VHASRAVFEALPCRPGAAGSLVGLGQIQGLIKHRAIDELGGNQEASKLALMA